MSDGLTDAWKNIETEHGTSKSDLEACYRHHRRVIAEQDARITELVLAIKTIAKNQHLAQFNPLVKVDQTISDAISVANKVSTSEIDFAAERNRSNLVTAALRDILIAAGIINSTTFPSGPELLLLAEDAKSFVAKLASQQQSEIKPAQKR